MTIITNTLVITAWVGAGVFVVRYLMTKWFRKTAGVLTMTFVLTAFSVLSLATMTTLYGRDWPGRDGVRFGVYLGVNVLLWTCVFLLFRDQHRAATGRHSEESPDVP